MPLTAINLHDLVVETVLQDGHDLIDLDLVSFRNVRVVDIPDHPTHHMLRQLFGYTSKRWAYTK